MYYLAASGVCLAALVGTVIYESRRLKKEEDRLRKVLGRLTRD